MKDFLKKHDIWTRLLALALAVCLWAFVMSTEKLERTIVVNVPLTLTGEQALLSEHGLAVVGGQDVKIALTVKGITPGIFTVNATNFKAEVDVSALAEAKTYQDITFNVSTIKATPSLEIKTIKPSSISLTVDKMIEQEVKVAALLQGNAPTGYLYGAPTTDLETVWVKGPQNKLNTIASAQVVIPTNDMKESSTLEADYTLYDHKGAALDITYLEMEKTKVQVHVPVYQIKTLPLHMNLRGSGSITEDMASVTITPSTVEVYGESGALADLNMISLGTLDLRQTQTDEEITRDIKLPAGVRLMQNQPGIARITLQIDGVETRSMVIPEINLIDTNTSPNKPKVTLQTDSVDVTLRGKSSAFDALNTSIINVSAQLDSSTLPPGANRIPVAVTLPTSAITVIDYTETVTVFIGEESAIEEPTDSMPPQGEPAEPLVPPVVGTPPDAIAPPVETTPPDGDITDEPIEPITPAHPADAKEPQPAGQGGV